MKLLADIIREYLPEEDIKTYCLEAIEKFDLSPRVKEIKDYLSNCKDKSRFYEFANLGLKAALSIEFIQVYVLSKINTEKVEESLYKIIGGDEL